MNNIWKISTVILAVALVATQATDIVKNNKPSEEKESITIDTDKDVMNVIKSRTSVRSYTDQAIPEDVMTQILEAGMAAPSGVNKQPWEFIVVTDRAMLDKLATKKKMLKDAQAAIIVAGHSDVDNGGSVYWYQDCSAASQNILLAAHSFGIGAVWTTVHPHKELEAEVREIVGMPESVSALNIISMGYPDTEQQPKQKWNVDKIHYNKW